MGFCSEHPIPERKIKPKITCFIRMMRMMKIRRRDPFRNPILHPEIRENIRTNMPYNPVEQVKAQIRHNCNGIKGIEDKQEKP